PGKDALEGMTGRLGRAARWRVPQCPERVLALCSHRVLYLLSKGPCCMSFPESGDALLALLRCKAPGVVPGRRRCVGKRSKPCAIARELFARACGDTRRPSCPCWRRCRRLRTKCERRRTTPYAFRRLDVAQWVLGRAYN